MPLYNTSFHRPFLAVITVLVSTSCERQVEKATQGDSIQVAATVIGVPAVPPSDTIGPGSVNWTLSGLHSRLCNVGLEPVAAGEVRQPFMGGPGVRYKLDGGELQAYIYADAGAVARDTDRLDTTTVSPPTMMIHWEMPPTLIVSNNLVLILLTNDPQLRKKVRDAVKPNLLRHDTLL